MAESGETMRGVVGEAWAGLRVAGDRLEGGGRITDWARKALRRGIARLHSPPAA
jgi:hypothetical protein